MRRLAIVAVAVAAATVLATPAAADPLPPLNPAALEAAIAGLPNDKASGALLQVRGTAGGWQGTSGVANVHTGQKGTSPGASSSPSTPCTWAAASSRWSRGRSSRRCRGSPERG